MLTCLYCQKSIVRRYSTQDKKYCSQVCSSKHFSAIKIEENKKLIVEGKITNRPTIYKVLEELYGPACQCCGITKHNKLPIKCQVDHIDGDSTNNKLTNLRLICPNCHSQTDTFAGRNKGKNVGRWTLKNLKKYSSGL
jgi:5-methylcytosine-specific restriction endonuclease McrA